MNKKNRVTHDGVYIILNHYYERPNGKNGVLDILDELEDYLSPVELDYKNAQYENRYKGDLLTERRIICAVQIIEATHKGDYYNLIKELIDFTENYDKSELKKRVELNQYALYNILIKSIRRMLADET